MKITIVRKTKETKPPLRSHQSDYPPGIRSSGIIEDKSASVCKRLCGYFLNREPCSVDGRPFRQSQSTLGCWSRELCGRWLTH